MKNKKMLLTICIVFLATFIAIGCTPAKRPVPTPTPTPNQQTIDRNRTTTDINAPRTDNMVPNERNIGTEPARTDDMTARADRIAEEVNKIKDVKSASVLITERTALVGVKLTSETKGEVNTEIKREVERAVERVDKDIERVSVTANPDLLTRIENITRDVGQGRPLSGFGKEIEEIIRRITPGA